jgi:hypothetical protein
MINLIEYFYNFFTMFNIHMTISNIMLFNKIIGYIKLVPTDSNNKIIKNIIFIKINQISWIFISTKITEYFIKKYVF